MKRMIAAVLCASFGAGCATTATITRKSGQQDEATIVRGTSSSVMVDTGAGERPIPREEFPVCEDGRLAFEPLGVNANPFYAAGAEAGAVARASRTAVINVSAGGGSVPTFVLG